MSASNPNSEVFDHDAGSARHRCRLDPTQDPILFAYRSRAMLVRGQASPLLLRHRRQSVEQTGPKAPYVCCQILMSTMQRNPDCEREAK